MIRLTLLCSAATAATRGAAFPVDEPLDARGLADAAAAPSLAKPDRALVSPALRARQTAEAMGLTAAIAESLRDIDYGAWAGSSLRAIEERDPAGVAVWLSDPDATPHGGESLAAVVARTRMLLDTEMREAGTLVAVTHAALMRAAILIALEAPLTSFWRIDIAPLARVILHGADGLWRLRSIEN